MKQYTFLNEFFGFFSKNTITSVQFNNIVKSCIIQYLQDCIKLMSKYDGNNPSTEDEWGEECFNLIDTHLKKCSIILRKNGLNKFDYNKLCNDIGDEFEEKWKYSLVSNSKNWVKSYKIDLMKTIKKLSNPKVQLFDNSDIIREYQLKS